MGRKESKQNFLGQIWYYILSEHLKTFDVFSEQKKKALTDSSSAILTLLDYLMTIVDDLEKESDLNKETLFKEFMKVELMCRSRGGGGGTWGQDPP